MKQKVREVFDYKKPAFWIIVASIALFLIITVCVLKLFIGGSNGGDSDQWGLKGAPRDALNVEEHSYTSEIIEVATCTSEGTAVFTCKKCGDSYSERIEPTSHSYISAVASEGNCSAKSIITYTCSACGDTYTEEGELNPGIHSALTSGTSIAPTCTENGVKITSCSGCGYTATESMSALGHDMCKVSCTATCVSNGISEYRCSRCGLDNSEVTAAFGHSFATATCTAPETCTWCGLPQGKRFGHTVHGGTCRACGKYIPTKNVVGITGTDQRIYFERNDPVLKNYYIIVRDCTVDYSDPKGAIINFVVDATNAPLPDSINRLSYIARITNDMTGEIVLNQPLFIFSLDDPITTDSIQLYSLTFNGDAIPSGDYTVSFMEY